ncbi:hypothetical protein ANCCEY_11364 [Ancylostoma ceylanicum]|uniref:Uncharacterized protein n=1 Tax=Ancylostoma ceylanicum TaxID=53326 RepID=A0A0D6LHY6_9BILA|nr:hypothetical protein ANCCEY_11364 [Ancylostoma ceylanicum]
MARAEDLAKSPNDAPVYSSQPPGPDNAVCIYWFRVHCEGTGKGTNIPLPVKIIIVLLATESGTSKL